ncbi:phospholipase A1-IIgamma-like [Eucalyptus grandis]|uniref:phospholipase A1-IIgamma-like n=1 Tax=Eucalyptus grandis TaxID=71139 RepID=UPI00192E7F00|nr:phospholipase A1-IIgamma-like [Eucalyptus grandis]
MGDGSSRPWTELSGETNWKDMLDPIDEDLRMYLIHYGERVQAIYDAYNGQEESGDGYGMPLYPMDKLFSEVGLETDNNKFRYEVTRYFYVRSHALVQPDRSWAGYVAVSTDEGTEALGRRDILVTWRGTETLLEKYTSLSAREQVLREVRKQVDLYAGKGETISITVAGHSLGAALATINALDIVTNGYNAPTDHPENACLVTAFPFASPKVGDENFQAKFSSSEKLRALRVTNALDIVPFIPPIRYYHVGEQLLVDSRKSPYLKPLYSGLTGAVEIGHMLETYLHLIAGTQGIDSNEFDLGERRGIALVNKGMDALKDTYKIPAYWLVAKNKNMVQDEVTGDWSLATPYIPPPPEDN